jgi:hypothetical protein
MFIQRFIVTGIAYENLKENLIIAISGVTLVHQSPWGQSATTLLSVRAKFETSGKISFKNENKLIHKYHQQD